VSDLNSLTVLEYAVAVLDVKHIIVTGHYDCGAVKAASKRQDHGMIECWLRNIRDVYRHHRDQASSRFAIAHLHFVMQPNLVLALLFY
jgi:carbonic anhydrase